MHKLASYLPSIVYLYILHSLAAELELRLPSSLPFAIPLSLEAYSKLQLADNMSGTPSRKLRDLLIERDELQKQVKDSSDKTAQARTQVSNRQKKMARKVAEAEPELVLLRAKLADAEAHQLQMQNRLEDLENMDYVGLDDFTCGALPNFPALMRFPVERWAKSCPQRPQHLPLNLKARQRIIIPAILVPVHFKTQHCRLIYFVDRSALRHPGVGVPGIVGRTFPATGQLT
jgi:hypothetical protein